MSTEARPTISASIEFVIPGCTPVLVSVASLPVSVSPSGQLLLAGLLLEVVTKAYTQIQAAIQAAQTVKDVSP